MLGAVADLYLTMRVLILLDLSYIGRFWTSLEAWCAMQKTTPEGLRPACNGEVRHEIKCIHGARDSLKQVLMETYATLSTSEVTCLLSKPDIALTNAKDKTTMLPKVEQMDTHVKWVLQEMTEEEEDGAAEEEEVNQEAVEQPPPSAVSPADVTGGDLGTDFGGDGGGFDGGGGFGGGFDEAGGGLEARPRNGFSGAEQVGVGGEQADPMA